MSACWTGGATSPCCSSYTTRTIWSSGRRRTSGTGTTSSSAWSRTPGPRWCPRPSSSGRRRGPRCGVSGRGPGERGRFRTDPPVWPRWTGDTGTGTVITGDEQRVTVSQNRTITFSQGFCVFTQPSVLMQIWIINLIIQLRVRLSQVRPPRCAREPCGVSVWTETAGTTLYRRPATGWILRTSDDLNQFCTNSVIIINKSTFHHRRLLFSALWSTCGPGTWECILVLNNDMRSSGVMTSYVMWWQEQWKLFTDRNFRWGELLPVNIS